MEKGKLYNSLRKNQLKIEDINTILHKQSDRVDPEFFMRLINERIRLKAENQKLLRRLDLIENKRVLTNVENSNFDNQFQHKHPFFIFLLPSKRREEILGDLIETKIQMIEAGFPMWKVKGVLCFHMLCILIAMLRTKLLDYGTSKKKVDKDS